MKLVKARKNFKCTEYRYHNINPGDYYLYACCPPWHEMARGKKFEYIRAKPGRNLRR